MSNTSIIWSTPIYHRVLEKPTQNKIKSLMEPFIKDDLLDEDGFDLSNQKSSIRNPNNVNLPWQEYINCLNPEFNNFFTELEPIRPFELTVGANWINKYDLNDFQETHDHIFKNVAFSCVYYYEMPEQENPIGRTFFLNRYGSESKVKDLNTTFKFFSNHEKISVNAQTGSFVIFPSWLQHFTVPTKKLRITITTNVDIIAK